ncbi:MAG TPA: hypothetical protein VF544_01905 [Pyrinomonadaceae bacterium]|jgi:hypothetical protein
MTGIFGETMTFKQENGPDVRLVVNGDEHYARYETQHGHTVVYDPELGLYAYALRDEDGRFVSSRIPLSEPPPAGLSPHLEESDNVRAAKAAAKIARRTPPSDAG